VRFKDDLGAAVIDLLMAPATGTAQPHSALAIGLSLLYRSMSAQRAIAQERAPERTGRFNVPMDQ